MLRIREYWSDLDPVFEMKGLNPGFSLGVNDLFLTVKSNACQSGLTSNAADTGTLIGSGSGDFGTGRIWIFRLSACSHEE